MTTWCRSLSQAVTGAGAQKALAFYRACMDTEGAEARGHAPLTALLEHLQLAGAAPSAGWDLSTALARAHNAGVSALFDLGVDADTKNSTHHVTYVGAVSMSTRILG